MESNLQHMPTIEDLSHVRPDWELVFPGKPSGPTSAMANVDPLSSRMLSLDALIALNHSATLSADHLLLAVLLLSTPRLS